MTRGLVIITNEIGPDATMIARLRGYGVDRIDVMEGAGGRPTDRFAEVAELLGVGDKLVVCSLCDICRGVEELMEVFLILSRRKFVLVSLEEKWLEVCHDVLLHARSAELLTHICRFLPKVTLHRGDGMDKAARGRSKINVQGGRPKGSIKMNEEKLDMAVRMYCQGDFTVRDICDIVRCNERSMYRYLKLRGVAGMRKMSSGDFDGVPVRKGKGD